MRLFFIVILLIIAIDGLTQPYVDPLHIRYTRAFKSSNGNNTPFSHLYVGPDFPLKLRTNKYFVISPIYEAWYIDGDPNYVPTVRGLGLAMSLVLALDKDHWTLTTSVIPRLNGEKLSFDSAFQIGVVLLAAYKKKETLKYKFGVYANREFFGPFIIPLVGIDWRINSRNNLFGVLPGRITFEHKINTHFYTGSTFRAITNSYIMSDARYLRIDDNQISGFLDWYLTKHIVVTGEAGYGILRKLRSGYGRNKDYLVDYHWGDGMFVKLSGSYRIRL